MRTKNSSWSLGIAATFLLSACAGPVPSPATPQEPMNPPAAIDQNNVYPAPTVKTPDVGSTMLPQPSTTQVSPITQTTQAPQPPSLIQNGSLSTPTGGAVSLDQMWQQLPTSIPAAQAGQYLQPMTGQLAANFGSTVPGAAPGVYPGYMPELYNYGALSSCLYYNYNGFYVPYLLASGAYYPYVYSSLYNPLLLNACVYPLFYGYGGFIYPYYFLANDYCGGFLDDECNWPLYRSGRDFDVDNDRRHRRWGKRDFDQWVDRRHDERGEARNNDRGSRVDRDNRDNRNSDEPRVGRNRKDAVSHSDSKVVVAEPAQKVRKGRSDKNNVGTRKEKNAKAHSRIKKSSDSEIDEESETVEEEI
ncbi:MAG TPA: hypothetical protein DD435_05335 [Cyanobacteria bacterium UBA8530]|nr:hypothetical protein [Cyanobacteria bacterium UBA8530]